MLVGATTENPFFSLTGPLLSRSTLFRLEPLADDDLAHARAPRARRRANAASATKPTDDRRRRARASRRQERGRRPPPPHRARGRARARGRRRPRRRSRSTTPRPRSRCAASSYGDDEHYDIISAFIKSIRGSDPDAGLYWLARMLEAGEDARFIARRLVILATRRRRARRSAGAPRRRRRGPRRRVRRAARGRRSTSRTRCSTSRSRPSEQRRSTALGAATAAVRDRRAGPGADAPARRALPRRPDAGPRRGLRLSSRRSAGLGAAGAPAGRGGRGAVLPARAGTAPSRDAVRSAGASDADEDAATMPRSDDDVGE